MTVQFPPSTTAMVLDRRHPLSKGLVGAWLFNHQDGETLVRDLASTRLNATQTVAPTQGTGRHGRMTDFNGSSHYMVVLDNVSGGHPLTQLGASGRPLSFVALCERHGGGGAGSFWFSDDSLFEVRERAGSGMAVPISVGFDSNKFTVGSATTTAGAGAEKQSADTTPSTNTPHVFGASRINTEIAFYLDGQPDGTGSFNVAAVGDAVGSAACDVSIATRAKNTGTRDSNFFDGRVYVIYLWDNRLLTATDHLQIARDPFGLLRPYKRPAGFLGAFETSTDGVLAGAITGTSSVSGALTAGGALAGAVSAAATTAGDLTGGGALAGGAIGAATVTAALSGAGALAGAVAGTANLTGALSGGGALAGGVVGTSTLTATLTGGGALAGALAGVATLTAALTGGGVLAGAVVGTATLTGHIAADSDGALAGAVTGTSSVTGALTAGGALAGAVVGVAIVSGQITAAGMLLGSVTGLATVTGTLNGGGLLAGAVVGTSTLTGTLVDTTPPGVTVTAWVVVEYPATVVQEYAGMVVQERTS